MSLRTDLADLVVNRALAGAAVVAILAGGTAVLTDRGTMTTMTTERSSTAAASNVEPALPSGSPATLAARLPSAPRVNADEERRATEPPGPPDPLPAHVDAGSEPSDPPRSDVADRVHLALAGGLQPGDEGFGHAVADRARADGAGLGEDVSTAARTAGDGVEPAPGTAAAAPAPKGKAAATDAPPGDTGSPGTTGGPHGEGPPRSAHATDGPGRAGKPKGDRP